jgi:hypothetical protein
MDHKRIYDNIINNAKSENRIRLKKKDPNYVYYESHHIIPKCLGGLNDKENLVLLTAREHYVAHKLLTYIHPKNRRIALAFHRMTFDKRGRKISSRDFEYARKLRITTSPIKIIRKPCKKETKQKIGKANKGKQPWLGKHHSKETKKVLSMKSSLMTGDKNSFFGKHHSKITKAVLRDKSLNVEKIECEYCHKTFTPAMFTRWHGKNCRQNYIPIITLVDVIDCLAASTSPELTPGVAGILASKLVAIVDNSAKNGSARRA